MGTKVIHKTVLSETVREKIMESILKGEYQPGEKLVENTLAKEFGVSQAPVREAIKCLASLGLVSVEPYVGTRVRKTGLASMEEYYVVRLTLEGLAGRLAAENRTEEEIEELESLLEEMISAAKEGDNERRTEINQIFHYTMIEASHNSLLINLCRNVKMGSWSKFTSQHTTMNADYITGRHKEMIRLLKEKDADGMEKAVHQHIQESFECFTAEFKAENEKAEAKSK